MRFKINVDVSVDNIFVDAESEAEAKEKAYDIIKNNPLGTFHYHIKSVELEDQENDDYPRIRPICAAFLPKFQKRDDTAIFED